MKRRITKKFVEEMIEEADRQQDAGKFINEILKAELSVLYDLLKTDPQKTILADVLSRLD